MRDLTTEPLEDLADTYWHMMASPEVPDWALVDAIEQEFDRRLGGWQRDICTYSRHYRPFGGETGGWD